MSHYKSQWVTISQCESLWVTMSHYKSLWVTISHCESLYVTGVSVMHCETLYITVSHYKSLLFIKNLVHKYLTGFLLVLQLCSCVPLHTSLEAALCDCMTATCTMLLWKHQVAWSWMSANLAEMYGMPNFGSCTQHMQSMVSTQSVVTIAIYVPWSSWHWQHIPRRICIYSHVLARSMQPQNRSTFKRWLANFQHDTV